MTDAPGPAGSSGTSPTPPADTRVTLARSTSCSRGAPLPFWCGQAPQIRRAPVRARDTATHRRLRLTRGDSSRSPRMSLAAGVTALAGRSGRSQIDHDHDQGGAPHARPRRRPATASPADTWLLKAIGAEAKIGSVRIDGKIQQNKTVIYLDLVVNGDGEGGGTFIQNGFNIELERVGPAPLLQRTEEVLAEDRHRPRRPTPTGASGSRSRLWTPASSPSTSSSTLTTSCSPHSRATRHPSRWGSPRRIQGHKVVIVKETVVSQRQARRPATCTSRSTGKPIVYKIVNDSPSNKSTIVFSHYGKAVPLTVPPNAINLT